MSKILVDTIDTRSGTSTLTLGSSNAGTIALGSGDVQSNFLNPSFMAYSSGATTISDDTWTKVQFGTEEFDSDSCYDNSSNYRFTPTKAGKYCVTTTVIGNANAVGQLRELYVALYKNGSSYAMMSEENLNSAFDEYKRTGIGMFIVDMNGSSDYLEVYTYINNTSGSPAYSGSGVKGTHFGAYRIGT